jgi:branched-chain amino acid transport system permease protein
MEKNTVTGISSIRDNRRYQIWGLAALAIAAIVLASLFGNPFQLQQWSQWLVFCILAISFVWVWGHGGIFSFAQVAFFGVGAYAYGIFAINLSGATGETVSAVLFGVLAAVALAVLLGYFLFYGRVADVFVAIATLAVSLVFGTLMTGTADTRFRVGDAILGGFNGMTGIPPLTVGIPGMEGSVSLFGTEFFAVAGIMAVVIALVVALVRESSFGRIVGAIRENENRAYLLGIPVPFYKVCTFTLSAAIAGLAGSLYAAWGNFVDPTVFDLQMATLLAVWVFAGGRASLIGAFVGVFAIQAVSDAIATTGTTITPLILGVILIAVVLVIPQGIVPTIMNWSRKLLVRRDSAVGDGEDAQAEANGSLNKNIEQLPASVVPEKGMTVAVEGLGISFGGITAVDRVTIDFPAGGVHCLLGPNGAGKSTLFKLLVGLYKAQIGEIRIGGQPITGTSANWRARNGISIKSQVLSLFPRLSISENLWIAAYAKSGDPRDATAVTEDLLRWLGYDGHKAQARADSIAHGNQQWLDIAMALSQRPQVLLLDEPTAGMGREETALMVSVAQRIGEKIPVIIVEHDMDFVRASGAPVVVLHQGKILATGTLDQIRQNPEVLNVYLGRA